MNGGYEENGKNTKSEECHPEFDTYTEIEVENLQNED